MCDLSAHTRQVVWPTMSFTPCSTHEKLVWKKSSLYSSFCMVHGSSGRMDKIALKSHVNMELNCRSKRHASK
jgi:hypothetical protein